MRSFCLAVVAGLVVFAPSWALAEGKSGWSWLKGEAGIGVGPEYGFGGLNYEFQGKGRTTPMVAVGVDGGYVGGNVYFTKRKGSMPAGWSCQGIIGSTWHGDAVASASIGQRLGIFDWGVGFVVTAEKFDALGIDLDNNGVAPAASFGFRF